MRPLRLIVSSPEGSIFNGDIVSVSLRGVEGDLAILAGHAPFVTAVKPCAVTIVLSEDETKTAVTGGGIITVSNDSVTFLCGTFSWNE